MRKAEDDDRGGAPDMDDEDWEQPAWWYDLPPLLIVVGVTVAALILFGAVFGPWIGVAIVTVGAFVAAAAWRLWRGNWP